MSIWGANFTENDDAADWLDNYLKAPSMSLLKVAFDEVLNLDDNEYIEITQGASGLIAAQILSEILNDSIIKGAINNDKDLKKLKKTLSKTSENALNKLLKKAIQCIETVANGQERSELSELMGETSAMFEQWKINTATLIAALEKKLNPKLKRLLDEALSSDKIVTQNCYDFTVINLKKITCSEVLPRNESGAKWMEFEGFFVEANALSNSDEDGHHDIWISVNNEYKFIFTNENGKVIIEIPEKTENDNYFRYDIDENHRIKIEPIIQEVWHDILYKNYKILELEEIKYEFTVANFLRITRSFLIPENNGMDTEKYWVKIDQSTVYINKKGTEKFYKNKNEALTIVGQLFIRVTIDKNYKSLKIAYANDFVVDSKHVNDHNGTLTELDLKNASAQLVNYFTNIWKGTVDAVFLHERSYTPTDNQKTIRNNDCEDTMDNRKDNGKIYKLSLSPKFELERSTVLEKINTQSIYKYSDAYAKFLKRQNGFYSQGATNGYTNEIKEYLTLAEDGTTVAQLHQDFQALYGFTTDKNYNLVEENKNFLFKNYLFNIGSDLAGNNFVEILHGKYVGYIASIDHEMYLGKDSLADFVEDFDLKGFFEADLATATEMLCNDFLMAFHAKNMNSFINESMYYVDGRGIYFKYSEDKVGDES